MNLSNKIQLLYLLIILVCNDSISKPTITLFSHGIADTLNQAHKYTKSYKKNNLRHYNNYYYINTPFVTFNYPDATKKFYRVNYHETSFGQENEINRLKKAYEATLDHCNHNCNIILYGISRGASNLLIFMGLHQLDNIKALVLESPYFSMGEVIQNILARQRLGWLSLSYGEMIAEFIFKKYTRYGYSPKNCIKYVPTNIPIFIICSKEDQLVPYETSINVYKELVKSGNEHVYIFIVEHGKHASIINNSDGEKYQWIINAFYKKYNLPYCEESAVKGKNLLSLCQPIFN